MKTKKFQILILVLNTVTDLTSPINYLLLKGNVSTFPYFISHISTIKTAKKHFVWCRNSKNTVLEKDF